MNITKEQYIELVSSGSVPLPKSRKEIITMLKRFDAMSGSVAVYHDNATTEEFDEIVSRLLVSNSSAGYLSCVKNDCRRRKLIRSEISDNPDAFEESIGRMVASGFISVTRDFKRYVIL